MFPKLWISFWNFRACGGEKAGMGFPYQSERIGARGSPHRRMRSILLIARNVPRDPDAVRHLTSSRWRRLSECSSQLVAAASCQARGLHEAWPTCNRTIDQKAFWRWDTVFEAAEGLWFVPPHWCLACRLYADTRPVTEALQTCAGRRLLPFC